MGFETRLCFFRCCYRRHYLLPGLVGFPLDDFLKGVLCIPHLKDVAGQIEAVENGVDGGVVIGVLYL